MMDEYAQMEMRKRQVRLERNRKLRWFVAALVAAKALPVLYNMFTYGTTAAPPPEGLEAAAAAPPPDGPGPQ